MQLLKFALLAAHVAAVALPADDGDYTIDYDNGDYTIDYDNGIIYSNSPEKRTGSNGCNADNCLRNLRDKRYSSSASDFCSTWIQSTVTNTYYGVETDRSTKTQTPAPVIITDVAVKDKTVVTGTAYVTKYTTLPDWRYKREAGAKRDVAAYPPWLSASYPPERVSSACSCFIESPSPAIQKSVTLTTATETIVDIQTLPPVTNTVTQTSTHVVDVVATQTVTKGLTCGIGGCVWSQHVISQFNTPSIAACKAACTANPNCKAFDYSFLLNRCVLGKVDANTWWGSPLCLFRVYDRECQV